MPERSYREIHVASYQILNNITIKSRLRESGLRFAQQFTNYIDFDSETEQQFAKDCESNENIEFYIKLPRWFTIETPIGTYTPDWAIIYKDENRIYFVAETKGSLDDSDLRKKEGLKIKCGEKHFEEFEDVKFKKVTKVSGLLL